MTDPTETKSPAPAPGGEAPPKRRARIFSGMQPTGELHLGNYMGALANWVKLSNEPDAECLFCVVDQHALTIEYSPKEMPARVFDLAVNYLAAGIDPERNVVFVQSHVPEHTELAWYLATVTQFGELARMTQFKDKSAQHAQNINAGLFTYPVLMAADILLYRATAVPVGDDQTQHLELARDVADRFNKRFKARVFPLPEPRFSTAPRIMGLDGLRKMSKSLGNHIGMLEEDKAIWSKLKGAYTDPQRVQRDDPGRPEICNVYRMHTAVTDAETQARIVRDCRSAAMGCGDCKKLLAEGLSKDLSPVRERARELRANPKRVHEILHEGARKARTMARETLGIVREKMGLGPVPPFAG